MFKKGMLYRAKHALKHYWGFDSYLPLQQEAIEAVCSGRDSVVVLPTGGGKSVCFQLPAVIMPGLAIVVSPLISLMKDQIDALRENGIAAARFDSTLTTDERRSIYQQVRNGKLKILYLSPERLVLNHFIEFLSQIEISFVAIDEAHCVSMWGHDFRPEYRQLGTLKTEFPNVAFHAYTATATAHVRRDIADQLHLNDPRFLVGSFDRPNLIYKAKPRFSRFRQVCNTLDRHQDECGIVYCIRRKDVDSLCEKLRRKGYNALPYHAGMDPAGRRQNQEAFIKGDCRIIVATIAFGMGIDKSNVRFVIHTGLPKSLEHYQQESGRAGRDGLEAECVLFYSGGDYALWKSLLADLEPNVRNIADQKLNDMYNYATGITCRHRSILTYFGQDSSSNECSACDICFGDIELADDCMVKSQMILSCILRLREGFGADYTASVLLGSKEKRLKRNEHDRLSTYGLMAKENKKSLRNWIEQLVAQGYIEKSTDYQVLRVTTKGREVLQGHSIPKLTKPDKHHKKPKTVSKIEKSSWEGVDRGLFEELRQLRRKIATEKEVPAYIVFSDAALRDMARKKPANTQEFLEVSGVGKTKLKQYGPTFLKCISGLRPTHMTC